MLPKRPAEFALSIGGVIVACLALMPDIKAQTPQDKCNFQKPYTCPTRQPLNNGTTCCQGAMANRSIYLCDQQGTAQCVTGSIILCRIGTHYNAPCAAPGQPQGGNILGSCDYGYTSC